LRSISFRLVAWYAGLLAAIFVLMGALLYLDLRHFLENDLRQTESRRARFIANTLLAHVHQTGEPYVASQTKDWYQPETSGRFIRITRDDGTLIYASGAPKDSSLILLKFRRCRRRRTSNHRAGLNCLTAKRLCSPP
jgi:hypothetical protein